MADVSPAGSGGAPVPAAAVDGTLRIRGGVGGLSFQFEELLAGASALDGLVGGLADVEAEAEAVRRALFRYQSDAYTTGSNAIVAVGEAARQLTGVQSRIKWPNDLLVRGKKVCGILIEQRGSDLVATGIVV